MLKMKELWGICGVKGCRNSACCEVIVSGTRKKGGKRVKLGKRKLCEIHFAKMLMQKGN